MIRTALYKRVSHEEQALHGDSLRAQSDSLRDYAKSKNLYIVKEYTDDGYTAKTLKRPALNELLNDVRAGKIDLIIFTKIDRWSRGVRNYYKLQDVLDEHNVNWKTILEDYDTTTSIGQLQINIMLAIAENEANMTADRIKTVFKSKVSKGEMICKTIGRGYISKNKKPVIDEKEAEIIRDLFNQYEKLMNVSSLTLYAKDRYPGYTRKVIRHMLQNKIYTGVYESNYGVFENYCEPIISKEQFERVQRILAQKSKFYSAKNNHDYIFNGLLKCGVCGKNLIANTSIRKTGKNASNKNAQKMYRCQYHWTQKQCSNNYVLTELTLEKYLLDNFVKQYENYVLDFEIKQKEYKQSVVPDLEKIKSKISKIYDLYLDDLIDKDKYQSEYNRLTKLLEEAENAEKPIIKPAELDFNFNDENALSLYRQLTRKEKKSLWMRFIKHITIQRGKFDIEFI